MSTKRISLPRGTDFVSARKIYKRFLRKRSLPEYFLIKNFLAEHIFFSRADNPRDLAIVVAFLLNISITDICQTFGITFEEFISLHLPRCLQARLALFTEAFQALFVSAVVDRNLDALKKLLEYTIGSFYDLREANFASILAMLGDSVFNEEELKKSKAFKKFNETINESQSVLANLILNYQKTLSELLASKGIVDNIDERVDEIIAEVEERFLTHKVWDEADEKKYKV